MTALKNDIVAQCVYMVDSNAQNQIYLICYNHAKIIVII